MGSGKFGFMVKKDKDVTNANKTEFSVKEKCHKIQKKLKKTEKKKTEKETQEKTIWWNQCSSCKFKHYLNIQLTNLTIDTKLSYNEVLMHYCS